MNEAELIAGAIQDVQENGWTQSYLFNETTRKHCILGSIGFARWGNQWNIDCTKALSSEMSDEEMYVRLATDPLTKSLIAKIYDTIIAKDPEHGEGVDPSSDEFEGQYLGCAIYGWNDNLNHISGEENVLELLEKVQAEIGVE